MGISISTLKRIQSEPYFRNHNGRNGIDAQNPLPSVVNVPGPGPTQSFLYFGGKVFHNAGDKTPTPEI